VNETFSRIDMASFVALFSLSDKKRKYLKLKTQID
jgi:hypothetical protein